MPALTGGISSVRARSSSANAGLSLNAGPPTGSVARDAARSGSPDASHSGTIQSTIVVTPRPTTSGRWRGSRHISQRP